MFKILLAGDGGQGIQLLSNIICESAFEKGLEVTHIPNYGLEQRGGVSLSFIKIDDKKIPYPKFTTPDLMFIISDQSRGRVENHLGEGQEVLDIKDFKEKLDGENIVLRSWNIFFLGAILKRLDGEGLVDMDFAKKYLENKLSPKPGWEDNLKAFEFGFKS